MEYCFLFGEVIGTQDKFIFFKSSGKFKETNITNTVNEFMNLCELALQQNNVIKIYGHYTKRSHVTHFYAESTTIYTEKPQHVYVGWKVLRDKFKRRFGKDVEILHEKYYGSIIVKNTNIGSNLLKDI